MKYLFRKILFFVPYYKYINLVIKLLKIINTLFIMESGILTREEEKWLAKFMDSAIKLKGIMELIDGGLIRVVISTLDNAIIGKRVPEEWQNPLKELVRLGRLRDKEGIALLLDSKIDIPFIPDVYEQLGFEAAVKFIGAKMYAYIDSVEIEEED